MTDRKPDKVLARWVDLGGGKATWSWVALVRVRRFTGIDEEKFVEELKHDQVGRLEPAPELHAGTPPRIIRHRIAELLGIPSSRVEVLR